MNDRTRRILVLIIAGVGSTSAALSVVLFGGIQNLLSMALLASLAGTLGHFAFTWLGGRLMRLEKRLERACPGAPVYAFGRLPPEESEQAGGKGRALAVLFQKGFPVPDGCILLPSAFVGDEVSEPAWALVEKQLARLRRGKATAFAVRSSALCEDSTQASFAGEFESVLGVRSAAEIRAAIRAVRQSRHSARVQAYRQAQALEAGEMPLAVVIQRFIPADYAGVLFTADPLSGDRMVMMGNFVPGTGEKLVSGQVSAAEFRFQRTQGVYSGPEVLLPLAKTLHREAHEIENEQGCPQDIEWAACGGRLYILQARPITTLDAYDPITADWNSTRLGNFLWSATNMMEACPDVLTPFTASLRSYLDTIGGPALTVKNTPINGIIAGRFYANISVQVTAFLRVFKGDAHRTYREMAGWWGEIPPDMPIPLLPLTKKEWEQTMLPNLLSTVWQFVLYRRKAPAFLAQNRQKCAVMIEKIRQAETASALLTLWHTEITPEYRDALLHVVAASSDIQVRLERELRGLVGAEDANALLSNLSGLAGRLESLGPMAGLGMVLRGELSRQAYLEQYGHRGVNEGEAAWARPAEDPAWLDRRLAEWQQSPVDIDALLARQQAAYQAAWERFCQKYPRKAKYMQVRLVQAAKAAQMREAVRSEATRGMTVLRAFALRAGEMLGVGADVFFLTIQEVLGGLAGKPLPIQHLPVRQDLHRRYAALPPYPAIIYGRFDPFSWAADPNRRSDLYDSRMSGTGSASRAEERGANILTGAPGALGVVEGTVRRLDSLDQSGEFQPGEVLVTTMTNIGWTPIFPRAAAIVTDLGAPLSHAAIVARELGIPAVVGCGDATARLQTGDRVRVDGGRGVVEIIGGSRA